MRKNIFCTWTSCLNISSIKIWLDYTITLFRSTFLRSFQVKLNTTLAATLPFFRCRLNKLTCFFFFFHFAIFFSYFLRNFRRKLHFQHKNCLTLIESIFSYLFHLFFSKTMHRMKTDLYCLKLVKKLSKSYLYVV